jgi:sugar phosphate isomerase/epimerase
MQSFSRRSLLTALVTTPLALRGGSGKHIPVGLELYSVREELAKDLPGTLQQVAHMGYQCVEFFAPYYQWTPDLARQIRQQLDQLGLRCYSTHNDRHSFTADGIEKAIELNQILGTRYIVLASAGRVDSWDGWKTVAELLGHANETMAKHGFHAGYHNHETEWKPVNGVRPMDVIASGTPKSVMLQLDVGTCVAAGADPVKWIQRNPGRIRSLHLKDWSPQKGYRVLFGEGVAPWKQIFAAAETKGGVEYYLIEQEGSDYPEMETAERCLITYRDLRGQRV